jgi:hypothetical protein
MVGTLCPIADLTKPQVVALAHWIHATRGIMPEYTLYRYHLRFLIETLLAELIKQSSSECPLFHALLTLLRYDCITESKDEVAQLTSNPMPEPKHHAYLLRLWQESAGKKSNWRFVLINLTRNEERGFASLERLVAFLKEQMDEISASGQMHGDEADTQNKY